MNFSLMDVFFCIIILLFGVLGASRGFIKELFGKGALILGIWVAVLLYKRLLPYTNKIIHSEIIATVASFLIIFLVVYLIVMIVRQFIGEAFEGEIVHGLDRTTGFILGLIEGLAFVALLLIIIAGQPWFKVQSLLDDSFFYNQLAKFIATPVHQFSNVVKKGVK